MLTFKKEFENVSCPAQPVGHLDLSQHRWSMLF